MSPQTSDSSKETQPSPVCSREFHRKVLEPLRLTDRELSDSSPQISDSSKQIQLSPQKIYIEALLWFFVMYLIHCF